MPVTFIQPSRFGFNPQNISGLVAWYDASDTSSITSSGGAVSQWNDKSGNNYHTAQSSPSKKPTSGTRTHNGLNVIDFDGADDRLDGNFSLSGVNTITTFAVLLTDTTASDKYARIISLSDGGYDYSQTDTIVPILIFQPGNTLGGQYNTATRGSTSISGSTATLYCTQRNGDTFSVWKNTVAGTGTTGLGTANFACNVVAIGAELPDGGTSVGNWDGWIAEIVCYSSPLITTDRQSVESYLRTKWGTP